MSGASEDDVSSESQWSQAGCVQVLGFFDQHELNKAERIIAVRSSDQQKVRTILSEVVLPAMNRIDFETGVRNFPDYFAWRLLHLLRG